MQEIAINTRCLIKGYYFYSNSGAMKVFLSMLCLLYAVEGYTFENKTKLNKDLLTNYEKKFRQGYGQIIPTELKFFFYMRNIKEFQESNGEIGVVGSLGVEWKDVRLVWNPSDYGGDLNQTSVLVDDIWTPFMVLMNPYEEIKPILSGGFSCEIWYDGNVSCIPPPSLFEALCVSNLEKYPYDTKKCTLQLYVSGYYSSDFILTPLSSKIYVDSYIDDGPWEITSTLISVVTQYSLERLDLDILMKRRPKTYLWHLSPIFVLSVIKILVFRLPNESGERISFSITILLAEIVFLTVIQEKLPRASKSNAPVLLMKQFWDILISFFILLGTIEASVRYNRAKTVEPKKTEETPVDHELNVQTKDEKFSGLHVDILSGIFVLLLMMLNNVACYAFVSSSN